MIPIKRLARIGVAVTDVRLLIAICFVFNLGTGSFAVRSVNAQVPTAKLLHVFPVGGKIGSAVEVTVAGADLDESAEMVFSDPRITAKVKMTAGTEFAASVPISNQFVVTIPADVEPGIVEVRLSGRFGLSTPRRFVVGVGDELINSDQNKTAETAMPISVNSVVNGRAVANAAHFFKFALKKDEKVTIDCSTRFIDSRMHPVLTIMDLNGKELARARSTSVRPATLFFKSPIESQFIVSVRDAVFAGNADYFYRLGVSNRPYLTAVFPSVVQANSNPVLNLYGWNLPGGRMLDGPLEELSRNAAEVVGDSRNSDDLPLWTSNFSVDWKSVGLYEKGKLLSNRLPVYGTHLPVAVENETDESTTVTIPTVVSGRFLPGTESDFYEFDAKTGEIYYLDAYSHRNGDDSDLIMTVQQKQTDGEGKVSWKRLTVADDPGNRGGGPGPDFSITTDDPTIRFQVPADGRFRLVLKDQFGTYQNNRASSYRVVIRKPTPDFSVVCTPVMGRPANANQILAKSLSLRKGGRIQVPTKIERVDGFNGVVTLFCENLPPGVQCQPVEINPSQTQVQLIFHASEDAPAGHSFVKVLAKSTVGGVELIRPAVTTVVSWGTANKTQSPPFFRRTASLELAVLPAGQAPISVSLGDGKPLETSLGGKIKIPVKINRRNFSEAIKLVAESLPGQLKPGDLTIPKDKSDATLEVFVKDKNTKTGVYTFSFKGDAKFKFSRNPEAASRAEAEHKKLDELAKKTMAEKTSATASMAAETKKLPEMDKQIAAAKVLLEQAQRKVDDAVVKVSQLEAVIVKSRGQTSPSVDPLLISAAEAQLADLKKQMESAKASDLKSSQDSLAAIEKSKVDGMAAVEAAKKQIAALDARQKQVAAASKAAKTKVDNLKKQSAPKDLFYMAVSNPVKLKIVESPLVISPVANQSTPVGSTMTTKLKIERRYGFAEAVTLNFKVAGGVPGIVVKPVTIAKDQLDVPVVVEIQDKCPAGNHTMEILATAKFNNVDVRATGNIVVNVTPKSAP